MIESKAWRVDYRKLNPSCKYCGEDSTTISVTTTTAGDVLVSTLCDEHAKGEKEHCKEKGMVFAGDSVVAGAWTDATMLDPSVLLEMSDAALGADRIKEAAEILAKRKGLPVTNLEEVGKSDDEKAKA